MMKRTRLVSTCLFSLVAASLHADSALFVNSAPIGAEVTINGSAYGTTPLLARDLPAGEYEVTVIKRGHVPATGRIAIGTAEVAAVELRPQPSSFVGSFSADETVVGEQRFSRQESTLVLPSGTYELTADERTLRLSPVYPQESALRAAQFATIGAGFAALIATVEDLIVGDGRSYFTSYLPSPATITAWTLAAGAGGFWIALSADRREYEERMRVLPFTGTLTAAEAERFYLEGEAALEAGNLSRALTNYTRVVADGGDSEFIPQALYKSTQIYGVSGDLELAARLLELLVRNYPAPQVYDRALRALADVYVALGRYEDAIGRLQEMVYFDPLYDRQEIASDVAEIRSLQEGPE